MSTTDTLRTAETLREAGVPERQAAAHARAIDEAVGDGHNELATRTDLARLESRIYRALLIQTAAIVGAMVALIRLIP